MQNHNPAPSSLSDALTAWGFWPACIMVLTQWEVIHLLKLETSWPVHLITFAGTLAIYGGDRRLERHTLRVIAPRHRAQLVYDLGFLIVFITFALIAMPHLNQDHWLWLLQLAILGGLYLLTTIGKIPNFIVSKEILGAACFTWVTCGAQQVIEPQLFIIIFLIGLSNFLWSSYQDRLRDYSNDLRSLATTYPGLNEFFSRTLALGAFIWFYWTFDSLSALAGVAICHAIWSCSTKLSIDFAFVPLLIVPIPTNMF